MSWEYTIEIWSKKWKLPVKIVKRIMAKDKPISQLVKFIEDRLGKKLKVKIYRRKKDGYEKWTIETPNYILYVTKKRAK